MKKFLSLLLVLAMVFSIIPASVFAEESKTITVYVTLSNSGSFVTDKNGDQIVNRIIKLTGKSSYSINDALETLHEEYYVDGISGYSSSDTQYGLSLTKLWGNSSGNFGYQVSGGAISVSGLSQEINDGDYIDACIYQSAYPNTEDYSAFDKYVTAIGAGYSLILTLKYAVLDTYTWNTSMVPCSDASITIDGQESTFVTDSNGQVTITGLTAGEHIISAKKTKDVDQNTVTAIAAPICVVNVLTNAKITVPSDADVFVGIKVKHYVPFEESKPLGCIDNGTTKTYYYNLTNNKEYNYRISGSDYVTYAAKVKYQSATGFNISITDSMLKPIGKTKTTIDRDVNSNNGYNVADILLNINEKGYIRLNEINDTYQIIPIRTWQAVNDTSANYYIEPDFHYEVIDFDGSLKNDIVQIDENGLMTAIGNGTCVVLVTYDAMNYQDGVGGPFFGAIWPENTGVFVVSVGNDNSSIATNFTINEGLNASTSKKCADKLDSEMDVIYYSGASGVYNFKPEDGCTVYVANPTVTNKLTFSGFVAVSQEQDGSYNVPLIEGRNIVKVEKNDKCEYQVITSKKVSYIVNENRPVVPGDNLSIKFDKVYIPANKLAGIYNPTTTIVYQNVSGYNDEKIGGSPIQYAFASNESAQTVNSVLKYTAAGNYAPPKYAVDKTKSFIIPNDYSEEYFVLKEGVLSEALFGDTLGNHRDITLENGRNVNTNAVALMAYMGQLPDISIKVTSLTGIEITTQPDKTEYNLGDCFDPKGMVVTALYEDGRSFVVDDYTFSTDGFVESGSTKVAITYTQGIVTKTATVDVDISTVSLDHIAITTPPTTTQYQTMSNFDKTGMVVKAYYSDQSSCEIFNYNLSHGKLVTSDKAVTISYSNKFTTQTVTVVGRVLSNITLTAKPTKMSYYVGESLDPTGLVITAKYDDGTTEVVTNNVTYNGTAFSATGTKSVLVTYIENSVKKTVNITGIKVNAVSSSSQETKITVYFTLLGDNAHDSDKDGVIHTLKNNNLTTWIAKTAVVVNEGSTAVDVISKALSTNGIVYKNASGNYISSIKGLEEFSNGPDSGWMYTINGVHSHYGVAEQTVKNGDNIVLHYTDSYTYEELVDWDEPVVTVKKENKLEDKVSEVQAAVSNGIAKAEVKSADVKKLAEDSNAVLSVKSTVGDVNIPSSALKEILSAAGDKNVEVKASEVKTETAQKNVEAASSNLPKDVEVNTESLKDAVAVEFTIKAGDKTISSFGGQTVEVAVPVGKHHIEGKTYRTFVLSGDGSMEATFGKVEGGNANVEMKHFSTVVVTTEECTPFYDINVKSWYASAVTKAYYNKIVEGDENKFNPDTAFTRAMLVTMLYNLEGKPEVSTTTPFVDVNSSAWYGKAVNWAYANKIVEGKDKTHFAPTVEISREEMATMLYNYAKYKKYDVTKMNDLTTFIDSKSISSWALNAIKWANAAKIMEGNGNYLNPKSTAVRAEAATLVVNFLEKVQ